MKEYSRDDFKRLAISEYEKLMNKHTHRVSIAYRVDTSDLAYVPVTINCKNGLVMENYIEIKVFSTSPL